MGKLAVRGGSQVKRTLTVANKVLYLRPFTPVGAIAIAHADSSTKHYLYRLTPDMAFFSGAEATSKHDLGWDIATPARPVGAELFEKMYIADGTTDYTARRGLVSVDADGTILNISFDLGGGSQQLRPYVAEEFNNHLFIAGYDNLTLPNEPSVLRHSYLGVAPGATGGFDPLAYNYIGAKGQRITGLKKGRGLMLIAKPNELHRLTGSGAAKPGWQFATEMVQTSQGLGVSNPYALCYAAGAGGGPGYWYGLGEGGPFRSDGFSAESLVLYRGRSWGKVTNLDKAWVVYHPSRNVVLFGVNQTPVPAGRSATYPTIAWIWDCQREVWMGDVAMSADMHYAHAIPTTTAQGPTAVPVAGGLAVTHATATLTGIDVTWTNGDATAATEIWLRDVTNNGSDYLWATGAAGTVSAALGSLTAGANYKVKIRHTKGGVVSVFTSEVDAYTLLPAPVLSEGGTGSHFGPPARTAASAVAINHGTLYTEKDQVVVATTTVTRIGHYSLVIIASDPDATYRSRLYDVTWPAAIQYSAYSNEVVI